MEKGETSQFKGKPIEEIDIDLEENLLSSKNNINEEKDITVQDQYSFQNQDVVEDIAVNHQETENNKKKKKRVLVPWTEEQKKIISNFFAEHVRKKKPPRKNECVKIKEENPEINTIKTG